MDSVLPSEGRYSGSIPDMGIKKKPANSNVAGLNFCGRNYLAFLRSFSRKRRRFSVSSGKNSGNA